MVINNANAEKLSGNIEEAKKILSTEDWTATSQKYNICVAAINDDVDYIIDHMSSAVKSKSLYIDNFREWAVFQAVRQNSKLDASKNLANFRYF